MTVATIEADPRLEAIQEWLQALLGPDTPPPTLLSADASFRRYFRLRDHNASRVIMDAPPDRESAEDFVHIAEILQELGLSAPRIHAFDRSQGFLLLEDLGDHTFSRALGEGADEAGLYRLATDTLVELHRNWSRHHTRRIPPYDETALLREADLFTQWYWPEAFHAGCDTHVQERFQQAWRQALEPVYRLPPTLVLRDYHVDNLMVLAGRQGVAACGLLDFQDALIGSPAYDLVSLLRDARRDVDPTVAETMVARYRDAFPGLDANTLDDSFWILGAQRTTKIIGIFTRLWRRDNKPSYLRHLPRLWRLLEQELAHPALTPVRKWFDTYLPPEHRLALQAGVLARSDQPPLQTQIRPET
ncbi:MULTISPECIES: aminoglycoside phosphotransferase family protein [unclassified Ectothiorhodospira]|uniref:aminoglycoside phosphotransferase family protein n=1 Tax=unclassified Ectothiorhodospira TaxID=2684909 RepID=UPI001EE795E6|nr:MULTISPECIES: phosphotransferase [unclassified Ectothiorhodospira]MCG5515631.1 phosphotransferase [Ectothiorhodospira sp. 9100]MCG5518845.1 phosphotransferase [Ectothiorhodospira sp. 9905]